MKYPMHRIIALLTGVFLFSGSVFAAETAYPAYSEAELDQMLAPIALYPDALLSQVLMASTYPLEVVHAARWSREHPELEGDAAVEAVVAFGWDDSVKALVAFPELIRLMDENLDWTQRLGEAFLADEALVLETVQDLRGHAFANGQLDGLEHVRVEKEAETILIEPAEVRVVRVPYYTSVVYGDWWWPDYPPYFWDPPRYGLSVGFYWSRGYRVSSHFHYSTCHWPARRIVVVNRPDRHGRIHVDRRPLHRYDRYTRVWRHDSLHRRGVRYRSDFLRERYPARPVTRPDRIHRPRPPVDRVDRPDRRPADTVPSRRPDNRQPPRVVNRPDRNGRPPAMQPDLPRNNGRPPAMQPNLPRNSRPPTAAQPPRNPPPKVTPPPPPPRTVSRSSGNTDSGRSYQSSRRNSGGLTVRSSGTRRTASIPRSDR